MARCRHHTTTTLHTRPISRYPTPTLRSHTATAARARQSTGCISGLEAPAQMNTPPGISSPSTAFGHSRLRSHFLSTYQYQRIATPYVHMCSITLAGSDMTHASPGHRTRPCLRNQRRHRAGGTPRSHRRRCVFRASSSDVLTTRRVICIRPPQSPRSARGAGACSCPTGEAVRRVEMASTDA